MTSEHPDETSPIAARSSAEQGRAVDAGRVVEWLKQGWQLFLMNPGIWIGMTVVLGVIVGVLNLVPIVGQLALYLLSPALGAGLLLGCRTLRDGGELRFDHLFAGFQTQTSKLVMVGVYYLIGMAIVLVVTFMVGGGAALSGAVMDHGIGAGIAMGGMLLAMLIMLVLMTPLIMAIWFAPALVVFRGTEPIPAMKASFAACMKNMVPFLVYGVIIFVLAFAATLPLFLGWLVLIPVLVGAQYASYLDIFE